MLPTPNSSLPTILEELYQLILDRKEKMPEGSYTAELFKEGLDTILAKVKEESDEILDAAKNKNAPDVTHETADLLYHLLVLLAHKNIPLEDIAKELQKRRK